MFDLRNLSAAIDWKVEDVGAKVYKNNDACSTIFTRERKHIVSDEKIKRLVLVLPHTIEWICL